MGLVAHSGDARLNGAVPGFQQPTSRGHRERALVRHAVGGQATSASGVWSHGLSSAEPTQSQVPPSLVGSCKPRTVYFGTQSVRCTVCERQKKEGCGASAGTGSGVEQRTPRSDLCLLGAAFPPSGCSIKPPSGVVRPEILEGRRVWSNLGGGARRDKRRRRNRWSVGKPKDCVRTVGDTETTHPDEYRAVPERSVSGCDPVPV